MYFKKMVGKKCYLSPIDINDLEKYVEWLNSEEVTQYLLLGSKVISLENEKEILARIAKEHSYAIIDIKTNSLLGNVGLMGIDNVHRSADIGIFIGNKDYWGKGYGTEALWLMVDYSFRILNLHNILLKVFDYNTRAIKCYEKVGFKRIGERRQAHFYNNKWNNEILMDILPEDFYKGKN